MPLKTRTPGLGLMKGLGITLKTMMSPASTSQYPHVKPDLPPRTRGVIALMDENCTVCMLCSRECPDWCIYIDSHKETVPPAKEGGRARTRNMLDRFAIDFALCMYCGICIEVCPFDALFWSPEFEYSEYSITGLLHEKERLREWMDTVPAPPQLDEGADQAAEVVGALEKAASAQAAAIEAEQAKATEAAEGKEVAAPAKEKKPDVHVDDAGEIDQETYDQLIAEGKSERIARAKAKAAYVRKRKKELAAEQEAAAPDASTGATPEAAVAEEETPAAEAPEAPTAEAAAQDDEVPAADADAAPAVAGKPRAADIHVEGGEIDQETYDQLIAEGKSERIARAKAKAAWVRKRKQEIIDSGAESASAAGDDSGEGDEA